MRISDWSSAVCSSDLISASSSEGVGESPADEILVGVARLTDQRAFLEFAQHRGIAGDGEEAEAAGGEIALELVAAEQADAGIFPAFVDSEGGEAARHRAGWGDAIIGGSEILPDIVGGEL